MNSKFACFGRAANRFENTPDTNAKIAKSPESYMCHLIAQIEQKTPNLK